MKTISGLTFAVLIAVSSGTYASATEGPAAVAASQTAMSDGEIKKIDKDAGKLTIKHGELKNLEMPAMTMVFRVQNPTMIDQVKPGDKIKFVAEKVAGSLTVTSLKLAK
jgi:Cu(I)/Ag(I) efflux system protein CusF